MLRSYAADLLICVSKLNLTTDHEPEYVFIVA